ncbi:Uncharacterised protein [Vibrio cholerae]|nr:Uncharacterised protein [Vibrio cholerae]
MLFTVTVILMGQPKNGPFTLDQIPRRLKFGLEKPVNYRSSD